jgi:hypothetical protein
MSRNPNWPAAAANVANDSPAQRKHGADGQSVDCLKDDCQFGHAARLLCQPVSWLVEDRRELNSSSRRRSYSFRPMQSPLLAGAGANKNPAADEGDGAKCGRLVPVSGRKETPFRSPCRESGGLSPAISREAEAREAKRHHRPCRGFGDGTYADIRKKAPLLGSWPAFDE